MSEALGEKPLFLIRPMPQPGETVADYLQRLAKANRLKGISEIAALLQLPFSHLLTCGHDHLQAAIRSKATSQLQLPSRWLRASASTYRNASGISLSARVCAQCLAESDILSNEWSLPLSISCVKHGTRLLDHCPKCFSTLRRTHSLYRCRCGQDFRDIDSPPAPQWEAQYYELFAPWRIGPRLSNKAPAIFRVEAIAARITRQLIRENSSSRPTGTPLLLSPPACWLSSVDHPALESLCQDEAAIAASVFEYFRRFPSDPGNRYADLAGGLCHRPPRALELAFDLEARKGNVKRRSFDAIRLARKSKNSKVNIAFILGISVPTLNKLMRSQTWQEHIRIASGESAETSFFQCARICKENTYTLREVSVSTGIPIAWLSGLSESPPPGIITFTANLFEKWRIPKAVVQRLEMLRERLSNKADVEAFLLYHLNAEPMSPMLAERPAPN